jgi:hypothetical protein
VCKRKSEEKLLIAIDISCSSISLILNKKIFGKTQNQYSVPDNETAKKTKKKGFPGGFYVHFPVTERQHYFP